MPRQNRISVQYDFNKIVEDLVDSGDNNINCAECFSKLRYETGKEIHRGKKKENSNYLICSCGYEITITKFFIKFDKEELKNIVKKLYPIQSYRYGEAFIRD